MKLIFRPYQEKIFEHLISGGNKTKVKQTTNINKRADLKNNIDRSMNVESTQKIFNDIITEVSQNNSADVQNAVAASNSINLMGIECDTVNFSGSNQNSYSGGSVSATIVQESTNKIHNSIENEIKKKILNKLPNNLDDIQKKDNEMMKQFLNSMPGYDPNKASKLAGNVSNNGFGNKTNIDYKYNLDLELKKELNLDDTFKIEDNDDINSNIKNSVNQNNLAKCSASASANNILNLNDIKCKTANISNLKQQAYAESILSCAINQDLINEISTKIVNKIDKNFERMYEAAKDDDGRKKVAALKQAVGEIMRNISGLPYNDESSSKPVESSNEVQKKKESKNDSQGIMADKSPTNENVFDKDDNRPSKPSTLEIKKIDKKESKKTNEEIKKINQEEINKLSKEILNEEKDNNNSITPENVSTNSTDYNKQKIISTIIAIVLFILVIVIIYIVYKK